MGDPWFYSRVGDKLCCIASGKWKVIRVSLQGLDITYTMV